MSDVEVAPLEVGSVFHNRYQVRRCMKAGGMGAVYEVVQLSTQRRRALKTMLPSLVTDPDMRRRFQQEATVAAQVESEHLVEVIDAGVDDATGLPFLVMDYLRGETLAELLERLGPLPPEQVLPLLHQASLGLDRAHALGIVHRDLKPDNLFVTHRDDGTPHLKLLDFGIAKLVVQSTDAKTTRSLGNPLYMSPEQIRGDGAIDPRADLYSLGHIAFTLLTARAFWQPESERHGGVYSLLVKIMEGPHQAATDRARQFGASLPPGFDDWFERATALEPAHRFDSASELVRELAPILAVPLPAPRAAGGAGLALGELVAARSAAPGRPPGTSLDSTGALASDRVPAPGPGRRHAAWPLPTGLLALALLALGAVVVVRSRADEPPASGQPKTAAPTARGSEELQPKQTPVARERDTSPPSRSPVSSPLGSEVAGGSAPRPSTRPHESSRAKPSAARHPRATAPAVSPAPSMAPPSRGAVPPPKHHTVGDPTDIRL